MRRRALLVAVALVGLLVPAAAFAFTAGDKVKVTVDGEVVAKVDGGNLVKLSNGDYTVLPDSALAPVSTPTPDPTPDPTPGPTPEPPSGDWPGADNTGVPTGTALTTYTGPKTITAATTINAKRISGMILVKAPLTITNSELTGNIDADYGKPVTITDSEVRASNTSSAPAIGYSDVTLKRVEVTGAQHSVLCGANCDVQDSWLHGQGLPAGSSWHNNGFISNGGSNVLLRHNTIQCTTSDNSNGGGCTGDVSFFGDFSQIRNVTVDGNLLKATKGGYCLAAGHNPGKPYGGNPANIVITGNVFERGSGRKCGYWGAATGYLNANGNRFTGNTWDDGAAVTP